MASSIHDGSIRAATITTSSSVLPLQRRQRERVLPAYVGHHDVGLAAEAARAPAIRHRHRPDARGLAAKQFLELAIGTPDEGDVHRAS
jgi:hypothetical protein